ncbi:MAG: 6-phosphogluconolactonase [Acidobacteriota bacterium]
MRPLLDLHRAAGSAQLAQDLAGFVAQCLRQTLRTRERALLVVSGGGTPVPFFEALSQQELAWEQVVITLADERWVSPHHPDSNERLVRRHLLKGLAERAIWMPLWREGLSTHEALPLICGELDALPWPASVILLGMGGDGHTASLFPHDASWVESGHSPDRCLAVPAPMPPNVPVARVTLSPACLVDAEQVVIHLTGETKWAVLQHAQQEGTAHDYPIRLAWQQRHAPCHLFYAD